MELETVKGTIFLVALHYPPVKMSVGAQRTIHLARLLANEGWSPVVISVRTAALDQIDETFYASNLADIPVERMYCLNVRRSLSIRGKYFAFMATPDVFATWPLFSGRRVRQLVKKYRPLAVWSTSPVLSAHFVGKRISQLSDLPWIVDFRDPPIDPLNPPTGLRRHVVGRLLASVATRASAVTFVAQGARKSFTEMFPDASEKSFLIPNGFDPESMPQGREEKGDLGSSRLLLLHSGTVYADLRNPRGLFEALRSIRHRSPTLYSRLLIRFRGSGADSWLIPLAKEFGISDSIECVGPLKHVDALRELVAADALILLQGAGANSQVPAKLYEYACAQRPIIGLVASGGDTRDLMLEMGYRGMAEPTNANEIADLIERLANQDDICTYVIAPMRLMQYTRRQSSARMARVIENAIVQINAQ